MPSSRAWGVTPRGSHVVVLPAWGTAADKLTTDPGSIMWHRAETGWCRVWLQADQPVQSPSNYLAGCKDAILRAGCMYTQVA